jgi:polygalacturonase
MTGTLQELDIKDFGAVDDGETDAAPALAKAWDAAKASGQATRIVLRRRTKGVFLLSPRTLEGGQDVTLSIGAGVTLSALPYDAKHLDRWQDNGGIALRLAGVKSLAIVGEDRATSIVQGNGPSWPGFRGKKTDVDRPRLIQVDRCSQVLARGFTITDSPNFNLVFKDCEGGEASELTIDCPVDSHNTDGIHLDASLGFKVHDCEIRCGDDAIAINSPGGRASGDHEIYALRITGSHGISVGSSIVGDVHDLDVHDITMTGSANGIRIKSKPESTGTVRDASYTRFDMTDVAHALVIQSGTYGAAGDAAGRGASLDGVTITHVVARGGDDVGVVDAGRPGQVRRFHIGDLHATGYHRRWTTTGDLSGFSSDDVDPPFPRS